MASPAVPVPAASGPAPSGGESTPGQGGEHFDAHADAADLFEGPDSDSHDRGGELAEQALSEGQGEGLELPTADDQDDDGQAQDVAEGGPLEVGGLQFPSREALDQYIATNQGRLQAAQQQIENGHRWEAYAQQLEAELGGDGVADDGDRGAPPAGGPQPGVLPADFVDAYHATFSPDWYQQAEGHFLSAVNAQDEAGVKQGFNGLMSSMMAQVARFVQARETQLAKRIEPIEGHFRESSELDSSVRSHGALVRQVAGLADPGDPSGQTLLFGDLFVQGQNGPQFKNGAAQGTVNQIVRAMLRRGEKPTAENFGYHYAALRGIQLLSAPSTGARPRSAGGDPTLSGPGVSVGAPRRQPPQRDPTGLPEGHSSGRTMGIRRH